MKTVAIVQARMTSTRLPGKVLKSILGRPMFGYQVEQLRRAKTLDAIVVATTINDSDNPIVAFCEAEGLPCVRGSEHDVLSRYHQALTQWPAENIVRITSDCPLLDPAVVDAAVRRFESLAGQCDYLSNMIAPTYPYGMAVEVMTSAALRQAQAEATEAAEREHVTPFIYWHPERFRVHSMTLAEDLSHYRWTVDTPEDFELVSRIIETLAPQHPSFSMSDILNLLDSHPDWLAINQHIVQKSAKS